MFEITGDDIAALADDDLRALVGRLCEAELRAHGLPTAAVTWGGNQNAKDGSLDVRIAQPHIASGRPGLHLHSCGAVVVVWAVSGPIFQYSDTWQLVINTGTTIVTFLMVFLIQNSQNRDGAALQVKLDELIRASAAHNSFVGIEHLSNEELEDIRSKCEARAKAEKIGKRALSVTDKKARHAADQAVQ